MKKNVNVSVDNPWKKVKHNVQAKFINPEKEEETLFEELSQLPKIVSPLSADSKLKDSKRNQKKYQIYSDEEKNSILQFVRRVITSLILHSFLIMILKQQLKGFQHRIVNLLRGSFDAGLRVAIESKKVVFMDP